MGCATNENNTGKVETYAKPFDWKSNYGQHTDTCFKPTDENDTPPFKYNCPCDLYQFGEYQTSDSTRHIYIRGKNWNPHLRSCTFAFYEGAYNTTTGNMKAVKIHLLDVERFIIPTDDTEYGNNRVAGKVILVFYRTNKGRDTILADPGNTGIYHE